MRNNADNDDDTNSAHKLKNCSCFDDGEAERFGSTVVFVGIENVWTDGRKILLSLKRITARDFYPISGIQAKNVLSCPVPKKFLVLEVILYKIES